MKAISLPFRLDGYGHISTTTELPKIWADKVRSVIGTAIGERVMRPTFGCGLPSNLFELSVNAPGFADTRIRSAFHEWLPEVEFQGTEIVQDESSEGNLSLAVYYRVPNFEQTSPVTYTIVIG